ncbi:MAG: hypothetical protein MI921_07205 [Cytophagales bacterium]|nr:hypothetical protein [Cytophagales bacterium]
MFVLFEEMPRDSRVWIYQADRTLSPAEIKLVEDHTQQFLEQWSAHGEGLKCSRTLLHHRFLVISVDENHHAASGCSIDSSVHFITELGRQLGIDWFNRTKIAFIVNSEVFIENKIDLKQKIAEGKINSDTLTFNNLVTNIEEFEQNWLIPAGDSWLSRFFI